MKKFRNSVAGLLCMSMLLLSANVDCVRAAEPSDMQNEDIEVDTRPDYIIYVNRALNCITIKEQEDDGTLTAVKAMVCSCGLEGHDTPEGTFRTSDYYEWRKMVDDTYGRYAVRFNRKILFHSVPYIEESPGTLEWEEYNKLGENASLGCVRLAVEDAKWIYDNCKPGTRVIVYSDSETAGELGKPEALKIEETSPYRVWDPTDTDINNPWLTEETVYVPFDGPIEEFDYVAYADRYPDLREVFGYDREALYEHYMTCGVNEKRIAVRIEKLVLGSSDVLCVHESV